MDTPTERVWLEREVHTSGVLAQLTTYSMEGPSDRIFREGAHWLDFSLTPRPPAARARYLERWMPQRYERLGTMTFVPAGHQVQFKTDGGVNSSLVCHLPASSIADWVEDELEWTDRVLCATLGISSSYLVALCQRLAEEVRQPGLAGEALIELIASQIMIELARFFVGLKRDAKGAGLAPWRLRLLDERLAVLGPAPTLTELAELCRLSVRQLTRGYRQSRGCSIGEHLERTRADHAKRLLAQNRTVEETAKMLGFSDASNFSHAFRRCTGMSPREFCRGVFR